MPRELARIGVIGLGIMGAGIAEVMARSGLSVVGIEPSAEALQRGRDNLERSTGRAVKRGRLSEEQKAAISDAVTFSTSLTDVKDADLVIEAVPEQLAMKRSLFADLDAVCGPETIFATNTSSLSVTEIAVATDRPTRVIGMHFFNPATVMKLVEVVTTVVTDPDVVAEVEELAQRLGKFDVTIGDRAGFVANALLFGYLNHAVRLYESGYAGREDIDAAMTLGCGLPMGPLALMDLIGIDTGYEVAQTIYRQTGDPLHAPAPLIRQMVRAGLHGRKRGRGFFDYGESAAGDAAAAAPVGGARQVRRVGIVGDGVRVARLVELFTAGGYEVAVEPANAWSEVAGCDLVLEAAGEDSAATQALFAALDAAAPDAVLATTTSTQPIVDLAAATSRPGRVLGLHFPQPLVDPGVVEVVRTVLSDDEAVATVAAVAEQLGKRAVVCADRAGFVVHALLFPYLNDAVKMVEAHYATPDDIDAAMKLGCGYPMGPFEVLDTVGLDVALAIQTALYEESREPGLVPAPLLAHLVAAGHLGRSTGRGFRDHPGG